MSDTLFVIRGEINKVMAYVQRSQIAGDNEWIASPSAVGIHAAALFTNRQDAVDALNTMRHGTALLMKIVELKPA